MILLIEDSPEDAELTIMSLKQNNLTNEILHLEDGALALDYLFGRGEYEGRDINDTPKVVLLDLKMPKVGGIEVLRQIKSDERTKRIPVVVMTSSKEHKDIEECYKLGVNSYVVKPIGFEAFSKEVAQLGLYWVLINQPLN